MAYNYKRTLTLRFLFFLFFFLHSIPLVYKESYQITTRFNYSIVLALLIVFSIKLRKTNILAILYYGMLIFSFFLYIWNYSGTISALILSATAPYFFFNNIKSKEELLDIVYKPLIVNTCFVILASFYLYLDVKDSITNYSFLGDYFGIASINYVGLLLLAFCVLNFIVLKLRDKRNLFFLISYGVLLFSTVYYSYVYLTRTTFVLSLVFVIFLFRKQKIVLYIFGIYILIKTYNLYSVFLTDFLGSNNLYEVATNDNNRIEAILKLIKNSSGFNYNFRDYMSYSSLLNLLFTIFPISLIFFVKIIEPIMFFKRNNMVIFLIYGMCLLIPLYQMDFLSIFISFFIIEYIKLNKVTKIN